MTNFQILSFSDAQKIQEANETHGINYLTLFILLSEKGIFSEEEFNNAQAKARHLVEQEFARKRDERGDS